MLLNREILENLDSKENKINKRKMYKKNLEAIKYFRGLISLQNRAHFLIDNYINNNGMVEKK